jgi:RNA polymerase sigma-70 factor (ECF subfamily)
VTPSNRETSSETRFGAAWDAHRPYLVNLAFRMLGDIGEAEDAVQDAYARLMTADIATIEDVRGWLTVITSRLCLDQIRSARRRLSHPFDVAAVESSLPGTGAAFLDPADRVTLDDTVGRALTVVLDRLTPAERVAFVLHDVFQLPFETIAETVGRTPQACRQLARRARVKIDATVGSAGSAALDTQHRLVAERFIEASASGDLAGLLEVLDPNVTGWIDLYPDRVVTGADAVAHNFLRFWSGRTARLVAVSTGGEPVLLGFHDRQLRAVIQLTVNHTGRVHAIHVNAVVGEGFDGYQSWPKPQTSRSVSR